MIDLPHSRGQRTGREANIAQQDERARSARELDLVHRWKVTTTKTNDYQANVGEMVVCDPTDAGFIVYLPLGGRGGDNVAVHNGSASVNTITITPLGGWTVIGAASYPAVGARVTLVFVRDAFRKDWIIE